MVRSILLLSVLVFAAACPRGGNPPSIPGPLRGVKIQPWPAQEVTDPWRVDGKPAYVIVTRGGSDAEAIVWVTPDGRDLRAVYCVDGQQLENMRAQLARTRGQRFDDSIELSIQPDKHTTVCASTEHGVSPPPPAPPAPPAPPEGASATQTSSAKEPVRCPGPNATCNFVMPGPQPTGPAGMPPIFEIVRIFDQVMWNTHVFVSGRIQGQRF